MRIRQKILVVMMPVVAVSILATSLIALNNFSESTRSEIKETLQLTGQHVMDKISRVIFERIADIKFLASSNVISDPTINLTKKIHFLRAAERAYKMYASISLYDKNGIKIGDTRSLYIGLNESQKPFFTHAVRGEIYYDRVPVMSQSLSQYVIHFSAPLYNENGDITGVVVTRYPITKLNDIFRSAPAKATESPTIHRIDLIAHDGLVIYSNHDRKSILRDNLKDLAIFKILLNESDRGVSREQTTPLIIGLSQRYGESLYVGIRQGQGYLDYKGSGWFLILSESTNEAFAALRKTGSDFIIAAGIILVSALALILIFSRRLTSPISRLRDLALRLSQGNYEVQVAANTKDELGDLSLALEKMRSKIVETNKHLTDLVDQKTSQLIEMNTDLIESKNKLEALNKSLILPDKAKEEFIMMVSHELKTPITPAKIYTEVLRKSKSLGDLSEKQKKAIQAVHNSITRLEELVNDVLDVYKLDVGKMTLKKKDIAVRDLVNENFSELKPLMKDKRINFEGVLKPPYGEITVLCDPKRISQVICNLVTNSVDFVPDKVGRITLRAEMTEDKGSVRNKAVLFSVEDNGPGIPKDKVGNLFRKFYQIDTSMTRKHGGTGLGLAICKGIVEAHGGKIWVDLENSSGTCIKFTLPIATADKGQNNNNDRDSVGYGDKNANEDPSGR